MLLKFQSRRLTDPPGVEVGWGCAEEAVSLLRIRVFRATSETHGRGRDRRTDGNSVLLRGAGELESMWLIS